MKSTSNQARSFFEAHRSKTGKLPLLEASLQVFEEYQKLYFLQIKYSTKLIKLQEFAPGFPTYVADIGKHFLSHIQLPTGDSRTKPIADETRSRLEALLLATREQARDIELEHYNECIKTTSVALQAYSLPTSLAALLREKTSCVPDANIIPESLQLFDTINSFVAQEQEKHLKAAAPMEIVAEQASSAVILAELKWLRGKFSRMEYFQKNEPSRSNLLDQSTKNKSKTTAPPAKKQQQQQSRGRSPTPVKKESRGRSSSAASSDRHQQDSGKSSLKRSTSQSRQPSRSSR
jgi:hypothetical protein